MTNCQPTRTLADVGAKLSAYGDSLSGSTLYHVLPVLFNMPLSLVLILHILFNKLVFTFMIHA
jgi:hypothetical protein